MHQFAFSPEVEASASPFPTLSSVSPVLELQLVQRHIPVTLSFLQMMGPA